jgi:hypothetical protein
MMKIMEDRKMGGWEWWKIKSITLFNFLIYFLHKNNVRSEKKSAKIRVIRVVRVPINEIRAAKSARNLI